MTVLLNALQAGNRSGTGAYTQALARWLCALAGEPDVRILWPRDLPPPDLTHTGADPRAWDRLAFPVDSGSSWKRLGLDQVGVMSAARKTKARLVHYPANIGRVWNPGGTVVTVHDLSFFRNPDWFPPDRAAYYRWAVRRTVPGARRIIADSCATAQDLESYLGIPQKRIDVVYLGVDEHFAPAGEAAQTEARRRHNLPGRYFLYYGTLEPRKNLRRLIRAWSREAHRHDCDLVIAGRRGWRVEAIDEAAAESPHRERIHFPGFLPAEDQAAVLSAAEAFVWPSLWEGFGLPPIEAMACGAPVITSKISSMPEVVDRAAVLVNPEDEDELAHAMVNILDDEERRAWLRAAGPPWAAQLTWRQTAQGVLAAYKRALEND